MTNPKRENQLSLVVTVLVEDEERPSVSAPESSFAVLGRRARGILQPRFVRGFLGQHELRVFKEQREASLGCRGRR
jgi:hypothetical protein